LTGHKDDVRLFASHDLSDDTLGNLNDRESVNVIGIITTVKRVTDRKGRPMAFVQIEDLKGSTEALIFSDVYDRHQGLIAPDTVVLIEGSISRKDNSPKIIANSMERVQNLREKFQGKLELKLKFARVIFRRMTCRRWLLFSVLHKGETPIRLRSVRNMPKNRST
jgi:DNA polymerase III subunit alpha